MKKQPEERFIVEVTATDDIVCLGPQSRKQRIRLADLAAVYFETNDDSLFGFDWWLLKDKSAEIAVAFPLGATGEDSVLERLRLLPGFKIDGMNSTHRARFIFWEAPTT